MFKNTFQSGFLSILYSIGSKPLQLWDAQGQGVDWSVRVEPNFEASPITCRTQTSRVAARPQLAPHPRPKATLPRCLPAVEDGSVKRVTDEDIQSSVLELSGANVSTTSITCPGDRTKTLGIKLPFLVLIVKNMAQYFSFEVQVLDDKNVRRRFRASNFQVRGWRLGVGGGRWRAGRSSDCTNDVTRQRHACLWMCCTSCPPVWLL
jgi:hypothetical protein